MLNSLDLPSNVNDKDNEGQDEAEQEPVVNKFQISGLRQGAGDTLEQGVHDQESGKSNL